jgi:hypothetical protein
VGLRADEGDTENERGEGAEPDLRFACTPPSPFYAWFFGH